MTPVGSPAEGSVARYDTIRRSHINKVAKANGYRGWWFRDNRVTTDVKRLSLLSEPWLHSSDTTVSTVVL